jgi:predicted ATPase/DNA-binding SARP family transcriptional activator/DNA-binding CsgD family transcriptional regulator
MRPPARSERVARSEASTGKKPEAVRVWLLGGFWVSVGARTIDEVDWRRRKTAPLVKLLALAPGHRLHREQVMDLLWPDLGRRAASNNLRQALHAARNAFDPIAGSRYLTSEGEALALCPRGQLWVDVEAFEEVTASARRSRDPAAYRAALDLYTGDLLPEDRYEQWAELRREELSQLHLALLVELAGLYEERGQFRPAIEALRRTVTQEPTNEEAHAGLIRLYAFFGQRQRSLEQYERLREVLQRELGAEPGASVRALREEIAAGRIPPPMKRPSDGSPQEGTSDASKHNLPTPRTSFVGREKEMLEVKRALAMTRLLTLTGAGGSGKTRLALEVARDLVGSYPDGVWLVELAGLSEGALVPQAVAGALGVREQPGRSLTDTLVEALHRKQMLLVLDNCEHLVKAVAQLVDVLLDSCPRLRIMATSREALGVAGEVVWRVPPLSIPDPDLLPTARELESYESARLFAERARQRDPSFALTPENAQAVAAVCRRLDGIPLAVELAAVRVGALAVAEIAGRIEDSLGLLTSGGRTAVPRQRTLRGALEWSHDLLSESERILFRRLSAFAGGWTLEAAETMGLGDGVAPGDVLELLSRLVDKSLVMTETTGNGMLRYRMLEPVRQYAQEELEGSGEAEAVWRTHAEFFLTLGEEAEPHLRGPEQAAWFERLETEHDNLRSALSWAFGRGETELGLRLGGALLFFWSWLGGHVSEGRRWLERGLARGGAAETSVRAKALNALAHMAFIHDDYGLATALDEEALALYREARDIGGIAKCLTGLGEQAAVQGDYQRATRLLEESLASFREGEDHSGAAFALSRLAQIAISSTHYTRATELLEESLALNREVGNGRGIAFCLSILGYTSIRLGDPVRARRLLEESIALVRQAQLAEDAYTTFALGLAAMLKGEHERAEQFIAEGFVLARDRQNKLHTIQGIETAAMLAASKAQAAKAAKLWGAAEARCEVIGASTDLDDRALHEPYLAVVRTELGEEAWKAAWERGREMTFDEAVEYALSTVQPESYSVEHTSGKQPTTLTSREQEITALIAQGLTNRQIASELTISEHTAATHVRKILKKLSLHSRAQIGSWLTEQRDSSRT